MKKQPSIWKDFLGKTNKKQVVVFLLVGILLLVVSIPTKTKSTSIRQDESHTELELRLQAILEKTEGVGNVDVMITSKNRDEVEGVAIVADGADNAVVVRTVTEIVQALFSVDSHKIKVIKGNQ